MAPGVTVLGKGVFSGFLLLTGSSQLWVTNSRALEGEFGQFAEALNLSPWFGVFPWLAASTIGLMLIWGGMAVFSKHHQSVDWVIWPYMFFHSLASPLQLLETGAFADIQRLAVAFGFGVYATYLVILVWRRRRPERAPRRMASKGEF